ncbi:unnamed protein product, partial [Prorocentrum cordatum]
MSFVPSLSDRVYLARWIFDLRRDTGEPMPSYISRDDEAYHDVVKGFDTEYFKKQRTARLSARSKEWNALYSELNWFLYKIEQEGPEDAADKAKELNHQLWSFILTGLEEIPEHPDFGTDFKQAIPLDQLRGWLLLQRSRLSPTERAAVISAVKGNFDYDSIGEQLRVSWPDDELTNRDKKHGKDNHRHRDAQEIEEAETAFAAQQRSFEEARDLLRRVKTARKFYPDSASSRDRELDPEALDHRKDEAEGADNDVMHHPDGPCLKCGGNHETKDHKDRASSTSSKDRERPKRGFGAYVFFGAEQDAEMEANLIRNETSRLELETTLNNRPVIKNRPKLPKKQLEKTKYLEVEKSIERQEQVHHVKLPSWPTLEKLDDWILMSVKQSSSKGFGILDIGATSSIMGIEAAENLRDIIYEQTGKNIKMDVSQKSTFIFGDGNAKTCTGKATFPLMIAGVDGELEINILDADAPLLIGVDVLSRLGAVIDCEAHSVYFKKLGRRAELLVLPSGLMYIIIIYEYGGTISNYAYSNIIIIYKYGDIIDYVGDIITYVRDIIRISPGSITYSIIGVISRALRSDNIQLALHIRMSLNREATCRKAESQQIKLENEEMDGPWEQVDVRASLRDSGSSAATSTSTPARPTLQRMQPQGRLIAHQDARGHIFYTIEGSEQDNSTKRMTDTFLQEHLPNWEMWSSKLLQQWTQCRRWGRIIQKVFIKTIDRVTWKLDSLGLPVQLLPERYPTWPADIEHRAKIEPRQPCTEPKQRPLSQKSATSAAAREQNQELRATIETAKLDFLTKFAEVDAFAALSSEQIHEQLSMVTLVNHLKPLCKMWGLTQTGKKEEVIDKIIAYIIEQRGTAAATIQIKKEMETKKMETTAMPVGPAISAHYTQMCQHPDCKLRRCIAKNEPIVKMRLYGWRHQACAVRSAIFGAMCALATFGRLTMVEACTHEDSNLGKVCDEKGYHYERLGLFNENDLSKPQGYHKAKFLLDEKRPELFVSTPPCGPWSIMQNVNQRNDQQKENLRRKRLKSQRIFENNKRLIEHQVLNLNGSALAEQPHNSRSWQKTCWKDLHKILPYEVIVDGCACGLRAPDTGELMKTRWKFLTNDRRIWVALQPLQCRGGHYHEEIESSLRTEASGSYPKMLCRRILRALTKSQNQNYFEDEVVNCLCMAATQQPPTEPTPEEDEPTLPPRDGKKAHNLTNETVKKLESYIRLVLFDAFSWIRRSTNTNVMALAILDAGSDILYVRLIDEKPIPGTTRQVRAGDLRHIFATKWFPWMGRPKVMRYDPAGSAISDEFREWIESQGVYCLPCAADAHRQIGKIERAIEAFKEALDAFDEMVSAEVPTSEMFGLQTAARNDLIRIDGFSPLQRYAGRAPTGTTVNLSDEPNNLPLISAELQDGTFSRDAQVRRMARLAHIQTENSDRVKRAEAARFRSFKKYETGDLDAGTDLDEYFVTSQRARDTDLVYLGRWLISHWLAASTELLQNNFPGTWTFGDVQKQLDTNEVIDLSNEPPPTGEDWKSDLYLDRDLPEGGHEAGLPEAAEQPIEEEIVMEAPPGDDQEERASQRPIVAETDDDLDDISAPDVNDKRRIREPGTTEPPAKKQRVNAATQVAFSYYLQEGNFYSDYAYSVQQYDDMTENDELIVLDIPVSNEHAFMAYMDDPSNFVASQARKGRVEVSFKKATPEEKKLLLEAQQKECTSVLSTKAVRILSRQGIDPARLLHCRFVLTWKKDTLKTLQLEVIQCEPCVWVVRDGTKLVGMVILHVDDMMIAGDHHNSAFLKKRQQIQQAFEWTPWESRAFVQCGISIRQNEDYTCSLAQDSYSLNVEPIKIRRGRKPTEGVSDKERSDLRGRLGTVGWRAQQSAPWLSAEVSLLQAEIPTATVSTIQKINKLIRTMNDTADVVMLIPAIEQIAVVGWGDAAWAARITGESQGGEMIVLVPLSFLSGSTETLECGQVDYTNKQHVNDAISSCPGVLVTDGKSGYDAIEKSESAGLGLRDKRTSIECLGIRQQKEQTALQIRWVHSDAMLADGLTKDRAAKVLLEFFRSGQRWRLVDDPLHRSARKRKTEGMDRLDHGKPLSADDDEAMLEALIYFARDNPYEQETPAGDIALWGTMKPLTRSVLSVNSVARG